MKEETPAMLDPRYIAGMPRFITEDTKRWQTKVKDNCKFKATLDFTLPSTLCDLTKKGCSYSYCPTLEILKTINPRGWSSND